MFTAATTATPELWSAAHSALMQGRWSVARRLCEELSRRSDYVDHLSSVAGYVAAQRRTDCERALDAGFSQLLQDRIEGVNSRADRNRDLLFAGAQRVVSDF